MGHRVAGWMRVDPDGGPMDRAPYIPSLATIAARAAAIRAEAWKTMEEGGKVRPDPARGPVAGKLAEREARIGVGMRRRMLRAGEAAK